MPIVANADGSPLSEAEKVANEIWLTLFALRSQPTLHAAIAGLDEDHQWELEEALVAIVQAALDRASKTGS